MDELSKRQEHLSALTSLLTDLEQAKNSMDAIVVIYTRLEADDHNSVVLERYSSGVEAAGLLTTGLEIIKDQFKRTTEE